MQKDPLKSSISIVIVTWNSGQYLQHCLASIKQHADHYVREVIIVDNASEDGSTKNLPACVRLINNEKNHGFAIACNQGAAIATGEFILFLNPDVILRGGEVEAAVREMENNKIAVVGVASDDLKCERSRSCARDPTLLRMCVDALGLGKFGIFSKMTVPMLDWAHDKNRNVDHVIGAFYLIRSSVFIEIGGFDSRYFVYYEDIDLSRKVRRKGYYIRFVSNPSCIHVGGSSSSSALARRLFYSMRSKSQFIEKWQGRTALALYAAVLIILAFPARFLSARSSHGRNDVFLAYRYYWAWLKGCP